MLSVWAQFFSLCLFSSASFSVFLSLNDTLWNEYALFGLLNFSPLSEGDEIFLLGYAWLSVCPLGAVLLHNNAIPIFLKNLLLLSSLPVAFIISHLLIYLTSELPISPPSQTKLFLSPGKHVLVPPAAPISFTAVY